MFIRYMFVLEGRSTVFGIYLWMLRFTRFAYHSIETIVVIRCVMHSSKGTIRISYSVWSFNYTTVSFFVLRFVITRVRIVDSVAEFILRMSIVVYCSFGYISRIYNGYEDEKNGNLKKIELLDVKICYS